MSQAASSLEFAPVELLAVRAAQIRALCQDVLLTPEGDREPKEAEVARLIGTLAAWDEFATLPAGAQWLLTASTARQRLQAAESTLRAAKKEIQPDKVLLVLLEVITTTAWPRGIRWVARREQACAEAVSLLSTKVTLESTLEIAKAHKKALARLTRASVPAGAKVALAATSLAISAASAGALAPAIGMAIGGTMGLSGAAATSAGLAFLGGGSIASGGFGMAGGSLLVHVAAGAGYKGTRFVATSVASQSRRAFLNELAKLDVTYRLIGADDVAAAGMLQSLRDLEAELNDQRLTARGAASSTRARWLSDWRDLGRAKEALVDERQAERIATARRAVRSEIRRLTDPKWRRYAGAAGKSALLISPTELRDLLGQ